MVSANVGLSVRHRLGWRADPACLADGSAGTGEANICGPARTFIYVDAKNGIGSSKIAIQNTCGHQYYKNQNTVYHITFKFPGGDFFRREMTKGISSGLGQSAAAADPGAIPSFANKVSYNGCEYCK